jgi:hypothetical protein
MQNVSNTRGVPPQQVSTRNAVADPEMRVAVTFDDRRGA